MTLTIPLSSIGSVEDLSASIEEYRAALIKQLDEPGTDAPVASELVRQLVQRVPQEGPVDERGPDTFEIVPFVIIDDTPPPLPEPTLDELKARAVNDSRKRELDETNELMSPARRRLLELQVNRASMILEEDRTPDQSKALSDMATLQNEIFDIQMAGINREMAIEAMTKEDFAK